MNLLRSSLLAAAAVTVISGTAMAADLAPRSAEPMAPLAEGFNWTGAYVGINGGYAFGTSRDVNVHETSSLNPAYSYYGNFGSVSQNGGFGGAQAGYNMQFGSFVVGLEGDIQGAGISDTAHGINYNYPTIATPFDAMEVRTKADVNWFGTVRPRVGFAIDNILIYATGGFAFGGVDIKQTTADTYNRYGSSSTSDTRAGYALGGGVEYALAPNWTVKAEYQYIDLGKTSVSGTKADIVGFPTEFSTTSKVRSDFHTVRLGVNYKF